MNATIPTEGLFRGRGGSYGFTIIGGPPHGGSFTLGGFASIEQAHAAAYVELARTIPNDPGARLSSAPFRDYTGTPPSTSWDTLVRAHRRDRARKRRAAAAEVLLAKEAGDPLREVAALRRWVADVGYEVGDRLEYENPAGGRRTVTITRIPDTEVIRLGVFVQADGRAEEFAPYGWVRPVPIDAATRAYDVLEEVHPAFTDTLEDLVP